MATEFQLNFEDFSGELDSLAAIVELAGPDGSSPSSRQRVTAANAATLLLASLFEEHVRQQVKGAFRVKASHGTTIVDSFPNKIIDSVWRRSLEVLQRYTSDQDEWALAESKLMAVVAFCLRQELDADVADMVASNPNNMRPNELKGLFNQIGVHSIIARCCDTAELLQFLGSSNSGQAIPELEARLDGFFRRRNNIAHAIGLGQSSGPSELLNEVALFRTFAKSLADTLDTEFALQVPDA